MTAVYNPKKVIAALAGTRVTGFVPGSSIKAEYDAERTTQESGLDGEVVVSANPSQLGTVTLNLQASSPSNAFLQSKATAFKNGRYAEAFFPLRIEDLTQARLAVGAKCWVKAVPPLDAAEEAGGNEWKIGVADLDITHTGVAGV